MKRGIVFLFLLMISAAVVFASAEDVAMFKLLYDNAGDYADRSAILNQMMEARLTGAGEFYANALNKLVNDFINLQNTNNATEKEAAADLAMVLSRLLGAEKYTPAAGDLWRLVDLLGNNYPLAKAEALMALGRIRNMTYLPRVIRILDALNIAPNNDKLNEERVAFGAIIALEKFHDPSGFIPVFVASEGRYSDRIKTQAKQSLPYIAENPTSFVLEIIKGSEYNYSMKYTALDSLNRMARLDKSNKAEAAVAALEQGLAAKPPSRPEQTTLANIRKLAINMIYSYKTADSSVYTLLERAYDNGFDDTEKIYAVNALGSLGTDESVDRLFNILKTLNTKRQSGAIRPQEEQIVREIISALGKTKNPKAKLPLQSVISTNYTEAIKRLARTAITEVDKK